MASMVLAVGLGPAVSVVGLGPVVLVGGLGPVVLAVVPVVPAARGVVLVVLVAGLGLVGLARVGDRPLVAGLRPRRGPGSRARPSLELVDLGVLAQARPGLRALGHQLHLRARAAGPFGSRRCGGPARPGG